MSSALFTTASFGAVTTYDTPKQAGATAPAVTNGTDTVTLQTSDGQNILVFDSKLTALKCIKFMYTRAQWLLQPSDDVMVVSVGATKLLVMETTLINQKLITSFQPTYQGGKVLFAHRSMSQLLSLADALQSVGFCKNVEAAMNNNDDLKNSLNPTRIMVVDYFFQATLTDTAKGSLLNDPDPIVYDYTA